MVGATYSVFEIGQKYVERGGSLEGLSPKLPLYKVTEGNEPCFFTTFFSWDHSKAIKKAAMLFGTHHAVEDKSSGGGQGPRQRAEALAALNNAFNSSTSSRPAYSSQDRSNESSQEGPRQRAEALAALNFFFKSTHMEDLETFAKNQGAVEADSLTHWDITFWSERLRESKYYSLACDNNEGLVHG
ncbi:unnamed protein product [Microthlaspi erraticum]|uniref:Uncharacterized protein n=1 Tax=Microthlaspi erraticum TaxID=1685480 RepID=A0A6D2HVC5_9BRAS|nr:unnamed protein product [Microthlaspi erraticum]